MKRVRGSETGVRCLGDYQAPGFSGWAVICNVWEKGGNQEAVALIEALSVVEQLLGVVWVLR